ncbi:MAG: hypothetical protein A4E64_00527 [Syntrophorhabdus sp. PtaU1.Bin058]|nr:MAG: hypothetical protein A4E64_00527 [Syntrophorhabdus sp. PtaU1.Bin058]
MGDQSTDKRFCGMVIELLKNVSSAIPRDHHNLKSKYQKSVPIVRLQIYRMAFSHR